MRSSDLDYALPQELIAQRPTERRDSSRLLVVERATGALRHRTFAELPEEIGDALVVVNDTRVVPARLALERASGGRVEILLLEPLGEGEWEALARPSRRLRPGERLGPVELLELLGEGRWRIRLEGTPAGEVPLPPYIHEPLADPERYQTVFARMEGSAAAPTAGLHFTEELLERLPHEQDHAARRARHVQAAHRRDPRRAPAARGAVRRRAGRLGAHRRGASGPRGGNDDHAGARDGRVGGPAPGTLRALHHARARVPQGRRAAHELPPAPDDAARAGDGVRRRRPHPQAYEVAVEERYRFFSFGDAMLVV